jgi:hypothetical protein
MSNIKELGSIGYHTDDDAGMYKIGEVDGGWNSTLLENYVRRYGVNGILYQLAFMTTSLIEAQRKINAEKYQAYSAEQSP